MSMNKFIFQGENIKTVKIIGSKGFNCLISLNNDYPEDLI